MLELSIRQDGQFKIVKLSGRIDWPDASALDDTMQKFLDEEAYHIVFDLDEVKFICSGGIGALVYNLNKVTKKGGGIYIISDNEYVNFIFETLKFDMIFSDRMFATYEQFRAEIIENES